MECSILPTQGIRLHIMYVLRLNIIAGANGSMEDAKGQSVIYSDVITYMAAIGNSGHVHPVHTN